MRVVLAVLSVSLPSFTAFLPGLLAGGPLEERVYDLRSLIGALTDAQSDAGGPWPGATPDDQPSPWPAAGNLRLADVEAAEVSSPAAESPPPWMPRGDELSAGAIAELLRELVAPESWAATERTIVADGHRLSVVQDPAVHAAIGRFLEGLRAERGRLARIEVALIPVAALAEAERTGPWIRSEGFDAALERAGARGARVLIALISSVDLKP